MGAVVKDTGMDELMKELAYLEDHELRIGWMSDPDSKSKGEDPMQKTKDAKGNTKPTTVAEIAVMHEFGLGNNPVRSSLGYVMDKDRDEIERTQADWVDGVIEGAVTGKEALAAVGEQTTSLIKKRIRSNIPPELTEARKKQKVRDGKSGDTALVFRGHLINSVRYATKKVSDTYEGGEFRG
jgi:hypothetical protein